MFVHKHFENAMCILEAEAEEHTLVLKCPVRSALAIIIVRNAGPIISVAREIGMPTGPESNDRTRAVLARGTFGRFQITDVTDLLPTEIHQ